jgi:hypothetical protein
MSACADNAVLEVELEAPFDVASGDAAFAVIDATAAGPDGEWPFVGADTVQLASAVTVALDQDRCASVPSVLPSCNVRLAISAERPEMTWLAIRMRFCHAADCASLADADAGTIGLVVERPFYRGQVTRLLATSVSLPSTQPLRGTLVGCDGSAGPCRVGACDVAGCVVGRADAMWGYCSTSGRHACDP